MFFMKVSVEDIPVQTVAYVWTREAAEEMTSTFPAVAWGSGKIYGITGPTTYWVLFDRNLDLADQRELEEVFYTVFKDLKRK